MVEKTRATLDVHALLAVRADTLSEGQVPALLEVMEGYIRERQARETARAKAEEENHVHIEWYDRNAEEALHHACAHILLVLLQARKRVPSTILEAFHRYGSKELRTFDELLGADQLPILEQQARVLQTDLAQVTDVEGEFNRFCQQISIVWQPQQPSWTEIRELAFAILDAETDRSLKLESEAIHKNLRLVTRALLRVIQIHPLWFPHFKKYIALQEALTEIERIKAGRLPLTKSYIGSAIEQRLPLYRQIFTSKSWRIIREVD